MESREEMSGAVNELEKDVTLNSEPAIEAGETEVRNEEVNSVETPSIEEATKPDVEQPDTELATEAEPAAQATVNYAELTKEQLVEQLVQVVQRPIESIKGEVTAIKAAFFAFR